MRTAKLINNIANNKTTLKHLEKALNNPNYAAKILIGGSVAKDAFEYAIYANQTLDNKKIPEDKRKLIAAMDISTGIFSCLSQVLIGFTIANKKTQDKISKVLFKDLIKANKPQALEKCKTGLAIISSLVISTVLVKRILVPFLATPFASLIAKPTQNKPDKKLKPIESDDDDDCLHFLYNDSWEVNDFR